MKFLTAFMLSTLLMACATIEKPSAEKPATAKIDTSKLPTPEARVRLLYDVDKDGNVSNVRVVNRDEIKSEAFITKTVEAVQKTKVTSLKDGRKPPLKDVAAVVDYVEVP